MLTSSSQRQHQPVLITGVSSGIGLGMTQTFLRQGHPVIGSVRSRERAEALRTELGPTFTPVVFDICDAAQIDAAQETVRGALGGRQLAALINNAGFAEIGPLLHVPPEDLTRQLDVLVVGQLRVTQAFFQYLIQDPSVAPGRILNISSVSGANPNRLFGCYAAGKHALEGLSKTLRVEVERYGVRVVVVAPGNIATEIWPKQTADKIQRYENTDYDDWLKESLRAFSTSTVRDAMSVEEFTKALYKVFSLSQPAPRYTVVKVKRRRLPFSRRRVRLFEL